MATIPENLLTQYLIENLHIDLDQEYEIASIPARTLLKAQRIDLMAKWIYIDTYEKHMDMCHARELYIKHIAAFTEGKYVEQGNKSKNSLQKYICEFERLIQEFRENEFNDNVSLIPVGKNDVLLDGAHRSVCAAYFNKNVTVIRFPQLERKYDYSFFREQQLDEIYLDRMMLEYCRLHNNIYIACFWPVADNRELQEESLQIVRDICGLIVYDKSIKLDYRGVFNFMLQIYGHQEWTGSYENKHIGTKDKADACFAKNRPMRIVMFEGGSLERVIEAKQKIRNLFGLQNHAIHISDNDKEALMMAELLFNPNSIHHLKFGNPDKCAAFNYLFDAYRSKLLGTQKEHMYVIDSSCVLAAYGVRDCRDLDFLTEDADWENTMRGCKEIDNHESQFQYYHVSIKDLLYAPEYYFTYQGMKFTSLEVLKRMKKTRAEKKDKTDVKLICRLQNKHKRNKLSVYDKDRSKKNSQSAAAGMKGMKNWFKSRRKAFIEYILKFKVGGSILLKCMYPISKVLDRMDNWNYYYEFWKKSGKGPGK